MGARTVNGWFLVMAVGKLFLAQINGELSLLDGADELAVKEAFAQHVKPWIAQLPPKSQQAFQTSLAYFLKREQFPDLVAHLQDLEMTEPDDNRLFFMWMWQVLYPGLSPQEVDTAGVVEDNDSMAMNSFAGIDFPDDFFYCK